MGEVFPAGTALRDGYTGATAVVAADGTVTFDAHPNGVLLLERDAEPGPEARFSWDNATVYFVMTDRFANGDSSNDLSYIENLPVLLQRKDDTAALFVEGFSVRDYLVEWLTHWVREYGVDGFRCDTAKHVELEAWRDLHDAAEEALRAWKAEHPEEALDDLDFWMTAEVYPHGVVRDAYFTGASFDSVINFDFQDDAVGVIDDPDGLDGLYAEYADAINSDPTFNVLTFISSHDSHLFFDQHGEDLQLQFDVGTTLLLLPGGVQIYYGDETARPAGPFGSDSDQATRSDMNWDDYDPGLLAHWQRIGTFRNRHVAVGAGTHRRLDFDGGYAFVRAYSATDVDDLVVVVLLDE